MSKLGYDIEFLVQDKFGNPIPAGLLGIEGVKGFPERLNNGGLEVDCCAAEITPPPAETEDMFVSNILNLLNEVKAKYPEHKFVTKASQVFDMGQLITTPHAMTMGCDPDFNAWTGRMNSRPRPPAGLRSFGGHLHIEGGTVETIKACDLTLGMFSVLVDPDTERRKIYGRAGAFRPKPYGVEYRVMSNFWCDDPTLMREVYRLARVASAMSVDDIGFVVNSFGGSKVIQAIINTSNKKLAQEVFDMATNLSIKKAA